jgi:RNA polymerase sigma factor (sigma-70 family)
MEVSALKYSGGIGLHGRSPLLRLQSDERLISMLRRGNTSAFEVLVSRYESRLLAFCRHLLGSREDAEDVLQEVLTAAFNAILSDGRPINVRPWLYRIARNRSLNHLRRIQAIGVDSMDHHLAEHGASTADKVHEREEFRLLVGDIQELPETQKTALVLREMDALSYEQIAEAMETTVPSVKSLLVRARVSLAEAAEARLLTCEDVRIELAEVAEGLQRRPGPLVRRHVRDCKRCAVFKDQLKHTNKALAALLPVGPLVFLKQLAFVHLGHSAGSGATAAGSGAGAAGAGAAGAGAVAGAGAMAGSSGLLSAGIGAVAGKAAAGLAAAALVTAGAVEVDHHAHVRTVTHSATVPAAVASAPEMRTVPASQGEGQQVATIPPTRHTVEHTQRKAAAKTAATTTTPDTTTTATTTTATTTTPTTSTTTATTTTPGRTQAEQDPTVLPPTNTTPAPPLAAPPAPPVIPPPTTAPTTSTPLTTTTPPVTTPPPTTTAAPPAATATPPTTTPPTTTTTTPTTTTTTTTPTTTTTTTTTTTPTPTPTTTTTPTTTPTSTTSTTITVP